MRWTIVAGCVTLAFIHLTSRMYVRASSFVAGKSRLAPADTPTAKAIPVLDSLVGKATALASNCRGVARFDFAQAIWEGGEWWGGTGERPRETTNYRCGTLKRIITPLLIIAVPPAHHITHPVLSIYHRTHPHRLRRGRWGTRGSSRHLFCDVQRRECKIRGALCRQPKQYHHT